MLASGEYVEAGGTLSMLRIPSVRVTHSLPRSCTGSLAIVPLLK
jgi:hypothetical protein